LRYTELSADAVQKLLALIITVAQPLSNRQWEVEK
jgi:hypothetical protein